MGRNAQASPFFPPSDLPSRLPIGRTHQETGMQGSLGNVGPHDPTTQADTHGPASLWQGLQEELGSCHEEASGLRAGPPLKKEDVRTSASSNTSLGNCRRRGRGQLNLHPSRCHPTTPSPCFDSCPSLSFSACPPQSLLSDLRLSESRNVLDVWLHAPVGLACSPSLSRLPRLTHPHLHLLTSPLPHSPACSVITTITY